jgi:hypothetical protein
MTSQTIANIVFWGCLVSVVIFVYQGIILPGIRLGLRYRVFRLRDRLRRLVIEGEVKESDGAFQLLHGRLNIMCSSLARFDLARAVQASRNMDAESRARVADYLQVMAAASPEIQAIYKESRSVLALALTFNSLFFFILASICLGVAVSLKSGLQAVKEVGIEQARGLFRVARDLFQAKVDADTTVAFFSPELVTV